METQILALVDEFDPLVKGNPMNEEEFWRPHIEKRSDSDHVVVKGTHYIVGPEQPVTPRRWRGFGGDRYNIKFHDGRTATSTNMWCQGTIPAQFRDQLPDNAEFIPTPGGTPRT